MKAQEEKNPASFVPPPTRRLADLRKTALRSLMLAHLCWRLQGARVLAPAALLQPLVTARQHHAPARVEDCVLQHSADLSELLPFT
jgi:hypothetical protein